MNQRNFEEFIAMILLCIFSYTFGFSLYSDLSKKIGEVTAITDNQTIKSLIEVKETKLAVYTYPGKDKMNVLSVISFNSRENIERARVHNAENMGVSLVNANIRGPSDFNNTT